MAVTCGEGLRAVEPGAALCAADLGWPGLLSPCCTPCAHMLACRHTHTREHTGQQVRRCSSLTVGRHRQQRRLLVPPHLQLRPQRPVPSAGPIFCWEGPGMGTLGRGAGGLLGRCENTSAVWVGRWGLSAEGLSQDPAHP